MATKTPVQAASRSANPTDNSVERTRAWTGFWVVVGGDVAIAVAAILALWKTSGSGTNTSEIAILTSAFTAISTMTTAYFGIKTQAHTAQSFAGAVHTAVAGLTGMTAADNGGGGTDGDDSPLPGPQVPVDPSSTAAAAVTDPLAEEY